MTPDQLKSVFDTNAVLIMFVVGILYKYVPAFAKLPNAAIPWINAIGYILTQYFVPQAHASVGSALAGLPRLTNA